MNVVDKIVGLLAPQTCLGCDKEGFVLCPDCIALDQEILEPRCAGCRALSEDSRVCRSCRQWLPLKSVFITGSYEGVNEALVKSLKFKYQRQASEMVSIMMANVLEQDSLKNLIISPVPTAPSRIRQRGFDHAQLISKSLAKKLDIPHKNLLSRHSNVRQLGSSRTDRFRHMKNEFSVSSKSDIKGKSILLVDDVMTTGATLAASAKILKNAGAKSVSAIVFAQKNR